MKKPGVEQLNKLYQEALEADRTDFAEMRSSLLLISGDHYNKRFGKFFERIRTSRELSSEAKIRLTKNHIGKICKRYSNTIMVSAPGVKVSPKHEREVQDQKAAELNEAVWQNWKEQNEYQTLRQEWIDDFVGIGEVWAKFFYDPFAGAIIGYEPMVDEAGQPVVDEMGQQQADESRPIYEGKIRAEQVYGFNILRDSSSKDVTKSPWLCHRKMVSTEELKRQFPSFEDKIAETEDETFMVFDINGYRQSKRGETLLKEWFWRPSNQFPKGYYMLQAGETILDEGELPGGIFPLVGKRFDYVQTKARGSAATKPLRPFQIEINRAASMQAETSMTLGADKLIMSNGSKASSGAQLPGIRTISVTGAPPQILEGKTGVQWADYALSQVTEMYQLAEIEEEEANAQLDPHTLLFRSARQKLKFQRYISGFEQFLKSVCMTVLEMSKYYLTDEAVITAIGRNEMINIAEFKSTESQSLQIVLEEQSEDVESRLGRQLTLTHIMQYVGGQLDQKTLGKLIKLMPYANSDEIFSDLTQDYENATNDILALDRGEYPQVFPTDNHEYIVQRLTSRMKQADFRFLHPFIQQNYQKLIDEHMMAVEEQKAQVARSNAGFIPDGGTLIGVDYFVQDPNNPERTRRARIPYASVEWLVQKLQEQGNFQELMAQVPDSAIARGQSLVEASQPVVAQGGGAEVIPPVA